MKPICIAKKYCPFSLLPGTSLLLPSSFYQLTVYPAKWHFMSLKESQTDIVTVLLNICGPIRKFAVMQDLEKSCVRIMGNSQEGYFSFRLLAQEEKIAFTLERGPKAGITLVYREKEFVLRPKEFFSFSMGNRFFPLTDQWRREKIHFGCHKAQDWDLVKRRQNLAEILPIWYALGQGMPKTLPANPNNITQLLMQCKRLIDAFDRVQIGKMLLDLFLGGFVGIFSPRSDISDYWGILTRKEKSRTSSPPLFLLGYGAHLIRSLFVQVMEEKCKILPCLPKELHAGRFVRITIWDGLEVDMEWTKKSIRRMVLISTKKQSIEFQFPNKIKSYRVRKMRKDRGHRWLVGNVLFLEEGEKYLLDCFQK